MSIKLFALFSAALVIFNSCTKDSNRDNPILDVTKEISGFSLKKADGTSFDPSDIRIDIRNDSILIALPPLTDLSSLSPEFTIKAKSVSPASGISQNFSSTVIYTVTAEDGSSKQYKACAVIMQPVNLLFMGGSDNIFYALNAENGTLKWSYSGTASFVYSSPTYKNGVVYLGSIDNNVYAFNANNGKVLWKTKIATTGIESDAVFDNNTIYVGTNDDEMVALNAITGTVKWRFTTGGNISSSPKIANGKVYFGSSDNVFYALQASTGQLVWNYTTAAMINQSGASLVEGILYVGSRDTYLYAINAETGLSVWKYKTNVSLEQSSPTVVNGIVYIGGWYNIPAFTVRGSVYAINAGTGNLIWERLPNIGFSSSPFVNNNKLFICGDDGNITALNTVTGNTIWQKSVLANGASPLEANGVVYVGGGGTRYFYALDANTGAEKWKFPIPNALTTSSPLMINPVSEPVYSGDSGILN